MGAPQAGGTHLLESVSGVGRIHGRRAAHRVHNVVAGNRAAGPVSFLVCSAALAVALTLTTLYSPSYAVTLDGETVGVVADEGMVQRAIRSVEETGSQLLGYDLPGGGRSGV